MKVVKKIFVISILFCFNLRASEIWQLGGKEIIFSEFTLNGKTVLIEAKCINNLKCNSRSVLLIKRNTPENIQSKNGTSPHSIYCKSVLNAQVIILKNKNGDQNSFCLFSDGTLAESFSIYRFFR
ncbi:MAG: hypothetical protein KBD76_06470 [Bacteriovorax sp.]|nr:hypothetical protein [Bacteriovorax sp.]